MEGGSMEGGRKEVCGERVRRREAPRHEGGCVGRVYAHKPVEI